MAVRLPAASAEGGPYLIHNEPVSKGERLVGHVTSGGWGFRLGAMIGLASLHDEAGVTKDWIAEGGVEVQIAGRRYPLETQLLPFYDPGGSIMRG